MTRQDIIVMTHENGHPIRDSSVYLEPNELLGSVNGFFNPVPENLSFEKVMDQFLIHAAQTGCINVENMRIGIQTCKAKAIQLRLRYPEKCKLSVDLAAILLTYTMQLGNESLYQVINQALRMKDRSSLWPFRHIIWLLMRALNGCEVYRGRLLHRGVAKNISRHYARSETIVWFQFSSCTCDLAIEESDLFCGKTGDRTLFIIELTTTRARNVSQYTFYPGEEEVILPPNTRFEVISKGDFGNGLYHVHLRELPPVDPILEFDSDKAASQPIAPPVMSPVKTAGRGALRELNVDQVVALMHYLDLDDRAPQVRAKKVNGRKLAMMATVEDLGYIRLNVNPLEDKMLLEAIEEFKAHGVPPETLEILPCTTPDPRLEAAQVTRTLVCSVPSLTSCPVRCRSRSLKHFPLPALTQDWSRLKAMSMQLGHRLVP